MTEEIVWAAPEPGMRDPRDLDRYETSNKDAVLPLVGEWLGIPAVLCTGVHVIPERVQTRRSRR